MKEQVKKSETPAEKRAKRKARKYRNDCIESGKEVDYDYMHDLIITINDCPAKSSSSES